MTALLVESLWAGYAGVPAVRDVSFACEAGQVLSVLGPNGAGKTTTLLAVSGAIQPLSGKVRLDDVDITGQPPQSAARRGLILVPDDRGLFPNLTVAEHLNLAVRSAPARRKGAPEVRHDDVLGRFPRLEEVMHRQCSYLSGGEQQMLAIAKALLLAPRVLLVDELSMGLAPIVVQALLPRISELARDTGMAVVLVEQHYELALAVSVNALVMNHGEVVLDGPAADWLAHPESLEKAYFGATADEREAPVSRTD
jgi:branched-chain amino acid transport system ATP-binding protein